MKRLHEKASITVFLSLLLVLFIGFIMMMTEHARIFGLRQRLVCATDSAMDSLFSMYDRELLNEFDLMLLNENELRYRGGCKQIFDDERKSKTRPFAFIWESI